VVMDLMSLIKGKQPLTQLNDLASEEENCSWSYVVRLFIYLFIYLYNFIICQISPPYFCDIRSVNWPPVDSCVSKCCNNIDTYK
jgi:hypothetical protein